jgi:hypothetical protein
MIKINDETTMWIDLASEKADDIKCRVEEALDNYLTSANVELLSDQAWARTIFNEWDDRNSDTHQKIFGKDVHKADDAIYHKDIIAWLQRQTADKMGKRYELAMNLILQPCWR